MKRIAIARQVNCRGRSERLFPSYLKIADLLEDRRCPHLGVDLVAHFGA
jgi:hypothetical protein